MALKHQDYLNQDSERIDIFNKPEFRFDSKGRVIVPFPGKDNFTLSVTPGSKIISQGSSTYTNKPMTDPASLRTGRLYAETVIQVGRSIYLDALNSRITVGEDGSTQWIMDDEYLRGVDKDDTVFGFFLQDTTIKEGDFSRGDVLIGNYPSSYIRYDNSNRRLLIVGDLAMAGDITSVNFATGVDGYKLEYITGNAEFNSVVIRNATAYTTSIISGSVYTVTLNKAAQTWTTNIVFSITDLNTVSWTAGTIKTQDGTTYSVTPGSNTDAALTAASLTSPMNALTYIYLDISAPSSLKATYTYSTAVGDGKILVASAQNGANKASVIPYGGQEPIVSGENIAAGSIIANNIAANTITANEINTGYIYAGSIAANQITAGTLTGFTIQTAVSPNKRVVMSGDKIEIFNSDNVSVGTFEGLKAVAGVSYASAIHADIAELDLIAMNSAGAGYTVGTAFEALVVVDTGDLTLSTRHADNSGGNVKFVAGTSSNVISFNNIIPNADGSLYLGNSSYSWGRAYIGTSGGYLYESGGKIASSIGFDVTAGEANTASNAGGSYGWYKSKSGVDLSFRGFSIGTGLSVTDNTTYWTLNHAVGTGHNHLPTGGTTYYSLYNSGDGDANWTRAVYIGYSGVYFDCSNSAGPITVGDTSVNLIPESDGSQYLGDSTHGWGRVYIGSAGDYFYLYNSKLFSSATFGANKINLEYYANNPSAAGDITNYSGGGIEQFRGRPGGGSWVGSFDMTAY
jgi:hypothetical protein